MRILVAIPTKHDVEAECAVSVANLDRRGHEVDFAHADGRGVYGVAQARICVARKAVEGGYDRLMMVDSDVIVPHDAIKALLDPPSPVVLGIYRHKDETGSCPFFKVKPENGSDNWNWGEIPAGRFEVKAGGLGCAMVDVRVLESLGKPWFHWDERPTGRHTGEDIWFCERARKAGYAILADGRVRCGHVGRKTYR